MSNIADVAGDGSEIGIGGHRLDELVQCVVRAREMIIEVLNFLAIGINVLEAHRHSVEEDFNETISAALAKFTCT